MKITELPESAFAVYSEKLKQKKKSKPVTLVQNGTGKVQKKTNSTKNSKELKEMKEIAFILEKLAAKKKNVDKGNKINSTKNHNENVDQVITNENNKNKKNRRPKKKSKSGQTLDKNLSQGILLDKGDRGIPKAQSELPLHGKLRNKSKLTPCDQSSNISKKNLKITQNLSLEVEKSPQIKLDKPKKAKKKHTIVESSMQFIKPSGRNNNRSCRHTQFQKSAVNTKGKKAMSEDWTNQENSIQTSKCLFEWLIQPIKERDFMCNYWEKQPLLVQRDGSRKYYSELLSLPIIDSIFRENCVSFTKHVDVTSYTNGVRETHNLSGRAQANVVWDFYSNGCSIRLLNPQAFVPRIHALNASLQEYFGCFVGANVYLTPPNSQGFAPHYDDIEAFVLQIEGKKRWKVYPPRNERETLPRLSSPNFREEEIGKPLLEVVLEPGDMLYFPRGFIHQASTVEGEHSLHITLSAYQKTAWVDLLEKALPIALKRAADEDVEFRRGLPLNYLGLEYHGSDSTKVQFVNGAMSLMSRLGHFLSLSLGQGVDQMGAQFMHDALPPVFTPEEKKCSGLGGGLKMQENGSLKDRMAIVETTRVKLIRANICRLVEEEDEVRLYHCLDNPLEYHAEDPQFLVLPEEGVPVITVLAQRYPAFIEVKDLPHKNEDELVTLVSDLWEAGLLLAKGMDPVTED